MPFRVGSLADWQPQGLTYLDLYKRLLRPYGWLLGTWAANAPPCGGLLAVRLNPGSGCIVGESLASYDLGGDHRRCPVFECRLDQASSPLQSFSGCVRAAGCWAFVPQTRPPAAVCWLCA